MVTNSPIGIFDSGIGGLTVASAIHKALPNEVLIYYGDTAHMPYGDKSAETIRWYCDHIVQFLYEKNCRTIVIACNTASSLASDSLQEKWGSEIKFINVIDPVVESLKLLNKYTHIGVIGTKGTIHSNIYPRKLREALPKVKVSALATPLLAQLIEEGYFNNTVSTEIIRDYLQKEALQGIDCLVLACTHYPLIKDQISSILGLKVDVIDSSQLVAKYLENYLKVAPTVPLKRKPLDINYRFESLKDTQKLESQNIFYVSDFTESFQKSTELFFGDQIELRNHINRV